MGRPSLNNATALIDGDILVYRIGFASDDDDDSVVDEANANAYAEGSVLRSAALKHVPVGR